jgi:hypothetical protein
MSMGAICLSSLGACRVAIHWKGDSSCDSCHSLEKSFICKSRSSQWLKEYYWPLNIIALYVILVQCSHKARHPCVPFRIVDLRFSAMLAIEQPESKGDVRISERRMRNSVLYIELHSPNRT